MVDLQISETVAADANTVYDLISDITRMGEWSPENTGGQWIRGATGPTVGAWFKGTNRNGARKWSTKCQVTAAEPGSYFAFLVRFGPYTPARWGYRIEPTSDGCVVTEEWTDQRPRWLVLVYPWVLGIKDRAGRNRENMAKTLAALKRTAEAGVSA
jgi:hypothetical protein